MTAPGVFPPRLYGEVRFTVILDNLYIRLVTILGVVVVALCLGWMVVSNFIVRGAADRRVAWTREFLSAAAERFPDSARVNLRLARAEIADAANNWGLGARAEEHAKRAANLSPWNYQARSLLATAQELNGQQEEAENSLRAAVKLAPNYTSLNWELANLLLRRGKLSESFGPLRVAARSRADLMPAAIETIWRYSNAGSDALRAFAGDDPEVALSVVKFLTLRNEVAEANAIFTSIDKQAKVRSPQSPELVSALMKAGRVDLARKTWGELIAAIRPESQPADALVWNGGFELDAVTGLNQFDWAINSDKFAWVAIDRSVARTGGRSLKVFFSGLDTTRLSGQVQQPIVLRPGADYYLECYAKAKNLITPEGPRIAILGPDGLIGASSPVGADSDDWQKLTVNFAAPADQAAVTLAVVRIPKFSYDDPTRGIIWFDDFTLVER